MLLATKSAPPAVRAQLVERAALIEILSTEPSRRLTLLSAPAGWGKTTLLAQWVSGADDSHRRGWLSLDASDNDPARFWICAIAALRNASPAELLRTELHRTEPDLIPGLHHRASVWFAGQGLIDERCSIWWPPVT